MLENLRDTDPRQAGGPTLGAAITARGPLPVRAVLSLAAELAEALSAAHAADVIYPGLSPAGVVLAADGPRLAGPGIPQAAYRAQPAPVGTPPGMLEFTPPERAAGLEAGPASDMFSLGALLLYAATGTWMSHFAWHLDQLPRELRPYIERCMAVDPAQRPTAAGLRTELAAAYPDVVSRAAWRPAARPAPTSGWPAPGGIPASPGTPALTPPGTPALTPPGTPALAPPGAGAPAPPYPYPYQAVTPEARKRKRRNARRYAGLMAIATLAVAVVVAGTLYVIHPWPYPVLSPAALTAGQRGDTSISLSWPNPARGPLPDKYVVLRNGAVAATVPGNVTHFNDGGLAPATTYDFRVVAYRGGVRSQPSPDLRAVTRTPPVSQAVLNSNFQVTEKVESGGDSISGDADGDTWHDEWTFSSDCAVGPCTTYLGGAIDGEPFSAVLKGTGDGAYTGSVPINDYLYCGNNQNNDVDSTLVITVNPAAAGLAGGQWDAKKLTGSVYWDVATSKDGACGGGTMMMNITG